MANLPDPVSTATGSAGFVHIQEPQLEDVIVAIRKDEAFLESLQAAVASSSSWAAFQTAVASLTV